MSVLGASLTHVRVFDAHHAAQVRFVLLPYAVVIILLLSVAVSKSECVSHGLEQAVYSGVS